MEILTALLIKLALQASVLGLLLPPARGGLLGAVFVLWLASFGIGDLLLLPLVGPVAAAACDGVLAGAIFMILVPGGLSDPVALTALAVAVVEYFFHRALMAHDLVRRNIS